MSELPDEVLLEMDPRDCNHYWTHTEWGFSQGSLFGISAGTVPITLCIHCGLMVMNRQKYSDKLAEARERSEKWAKEAEEFKAKQRLKRKDH